MSLRYDFKYHKQLLQTLYLHNAALWIGIRQTNFTGYKRHSIRILPFPSPVQLSKHFHLVQVYI